MPDIALDLEELNLTTDLDENEENLPNSDNFAKISKIPFAGHYCLLLNLNILIDIRRFRPFCSLLVC